MGGRIHLLIYSEDFFSSVLSLASFDCLRILFSGIVSRIKVETLRVVDVNDESRRVVVGLDRESPR